MGGLTEAVERVPVVGVSLTANIGTDRQVVLQGHYARGDVAEGDALLAEMNRRIDVLKAPAELERLEKELRHANDGLANMRKNLAVLDENSAREQAKRVVRLQEAEATLETADQKARSDWSAKGKEGAYREGNTVAQMRARVTALRDQIAEEAEKHESEKAVAAEQCSINIARYEREIVELELAVSKQRALLPDGS